MSAPIPLIDLAVFRIGDAVYAVDDSCPHQGGSLSNGKLEGTRVICPVHGLKFNLDGACKPSVPTLEAKRYAVQVVGGIVMLSPDDEDFQPRV
jgi:3-phenylpropionate/trans-cinnamate dioxygenase ferredoxin subunit